MTMLLYIVTFIAGIVLVIDLIFRSSYRMYALIAIAAIILAGKYLSGTTCIATEAIILGIYFIQFRKKA